MKYILAFFICLQFFAVLGQSKRMVGITLTSERDTFKLSEPINFLVTVKNISKKTLYVPKDISLSSNLLPNGITDSYTGGIIEFSIGPISQFSKIFIENIAAIPPHEFVKLQPNSTIDFNIEIGNHLRYFNENIDDNDLKIQIDKSYELYITYTNTWKKKGFESKTYIGHNESNMISFFIQN